MRTQIRGKITRGNLKAREVGPQSNIEIGETLLQSQQIKTRLRFILLWK